jgi:beta-N-acetylhexosaminidase
VVEGAALGGRAFAGDPGRAAAGVRDAVRGFLAGGVAPTVKHFPGLGGARENTDDASVTLPGRPELAAFEAAIGAGVPLVMLSHARYPALDPDRIASQSPRIVDGLLRSELGFRGVAVTDSLEAEAVVSESGVGVSAERTVRAGGDLLLTTGRGSAIQVYRRLSATARRSPGFARRVRRSAARVAALRRSLG